MKYDLNVIRQLLIKHLNNKSAVAREIGIDRSNLNRYLRKMYSLGMLNEKYNVIPYKNTERGDNILSNNYHIHKVHSEDLSYDMYIDSFKKSMDKKRFDECVSLFGENRVVIEDGRIICYMVDPEDDDLSIEELEEKYDGFNG